MRLLIVAPSVDVTTGGGVAAKTLQLARELSRSGVEVRLATTGPTSGDAAGAGRHPGGDVRPERIRSVGARFRVPVPAPGQLRALARGADVALLMSHWSVLNALVARAMRRQGKPYVVLPAGALPQSGRSALLKRIYNLAAGRSIVRGAAAGIATTRLEVAHFRAYGIDMNAVRVIANAVDPLPSVTSEQRQAFRAANGLGETPFVLFAGRLNPIKGPDLLLRAFASVAARHPRWHLVFAGADEGMLDSLRAEVDAAGLQDCVRFLGFLAGSEKAACYREAALLAVPSRREAMSLVALEAGSAATPVLVTEDCGFPEVAEAGGGLVVPTTADGLARGLDAMLAEDAGLDAMGDRLRALVLQQFSWEVIVRRYREAFDDVLDELR
jgi:glycosyltransferase involved in cell wall biosynthesis